MKNEKSLSWDGLVIELIQQGGQHMKMKILQVVNTIWRRGSISKQQRGGEFLVPLSCTFQDRYLL